MRAHRIAFYLTSLFAAAACGTAPGAAGSAAGAPKPAAGPPPEVTPERIAAGKDLFNRGVCQTCHGSNGNGGQNGPPLSDDIWAQGDGSFSMIRSVIISGVSQADIHDPAFQRPMPQRGGPRMNLTDEQVLALASYVYSISHKM